MRTLLYSSALSLMLAMAGTAYAASDYSDTSSSQSNQGSSEQASNEPGGASGATLQPSTVRSVQQALNKAGYDTGSVDGTWGKATSNALMNYQRAHGLQPTGQPDQKSLQALNITPGTASDNQTASNSDSGSMNMNQSEKSGMNGSASGSQSAQNSGQSNGSQSSTGSQSANSGSQG